jgi:hypothetical protein
MNCGMGTLFDFNLGWRHYFDVLFADGRESYRLYHPTFMAEHSTF